MRPAGCTPLFHRGCGPFAPLHQPFDGAIPAAHAPHRDFCEIKPATK
jgi:hypothetical protein